MISLLFPPTLTIIPGFGRPGIPWHLEVRPGHGGLRRSEAFGAWFHSESRRPHNENWILELFKLYYTYKHPIDSEHASFKLYITSIKYVQVMIRSLSHQNVWKESSDQNGWQNLERRISSTSQSWRFSCRTKCGHKHRSTKHLPLLEINKQLGGWNKQLKIRLFGHLETNGVWIKGPFFTVCLVKSPLVPGIVLDHSHYLCASHLHVILLYYYMCSQRMYIYIYTYISIQRCIYTDRYINISLYNNVGKTWSNNKSSPSLRGSQPQWDEKPWMNHGG